MQKTGNGLKIESASIVFCVRHSSDHPSRVQKLGESGFAVGDIQSLRLMKMLFR